MSYEQPAFQPTGKIIINERIIEVMIGEYGELYTRAEWDAVVPADWELDQDGELTFQGYYIGGEYLPNVVKSEIGKTP